MQTIKVENLFIKAEKAIKVFFRILANNKLKIFLIFLGITLFGGAIFATGGGGGFFKISSPASVAAKGLVGYWPLDSASMKTASTTADLTPYGNDGTLYGRALENRLTTDRKQVADAAMSFDGVGDYVEISDNASLNPTTALTMAAWIKSTGNAEIDGRIVGKRTATAAFEMNLNTATGRINPYILTPDGSANPSSVKSVNDGVFHHIVFTRDNTVLKIYIDGNLDYTVSGPTGSVANTQNLFIGRYSASSVRFFNGSISDVRIYNRALSAEEVRMLYERY